MKKILVIAIPLLLLAAGCNYPASSNAPSNDKPTANESSTYTNNFYHYSIQYPTGWQVIRMADGTGTELTAEGSGVNLLPPGAKLDGTDAGIVVEGGSLGERDCSQTFEDMAKNFGPGAIQNYDKLSSIKSVTTTSGEKGYETTWLVTPLGSGSQNAKPTTSLPITLFDDHSRVCTPTSGPIDIRLENDKYTNEYEQMILTFKFTK